MTHIRRQVRDAVKTAVTGLASTGSRVHSGLVFDIAADKVPALVVTIPSEDSAIATTGAPNRLLQRQMMVEVHGFAATAEADLENTLDQIAAEVETALGGTTLSGLVKDVRLASTEHVMEQGERPRGRVTLRWQVTAMTREAAPEVGL